MAMRVLALAMAVATAADAAWTANDQVREAACDPRVAGALAAHAAMARAILAHDADAFGAMFADDALVNSPYNNVVPRAVAIQRMRQGAIDYTSLDTAFEHAAVRANGEVVLMGEEALTPVNKARFAGQKVRRRVTEVWTNVGGAWKLSVRQATVFAAEPAR